MSDVPSSSVSPADASLSGKKHPDPSPSSSSSLRPLAPRPPPPSTPALAIRSQTSSSSSQSVSSRRPGPVPCPVCYRVGCQLITHTTYAGTSRSSSGGSPTAPSSSEQQRDPAFTSSYAYVLARQYADRDTQPSKPDVVHELPLESGRNTPEMHHLFYSWFMVESQDSIRIMRPSGLVGDPIYSPFLMPAVQDPLLCLSVLAVSSAAASSRSRTPSTDVTALTLVGEAIQRMRERIDSDPGHISDSTIITAVFLWLANIFLEDTTAMASHSSSVYAFVETRGGLSKLGLAGAVEQFIRWVDIIHTFILPVPCHYMDCHDPSPPSQITVTRYGSYWDQSKQERGIAIHAAVVSACQATCRLLETLEHAEEHGMSTSQYFYIWQKFCFLCTQESALRTPRSSYEHVDECIYLAIGLIKFQCFYGLERLPIVATNNLERLVASIKATGGPPFWQNDLELLIWLLFIVSMVPVKLDAKSWCLPLLCHAVATKFGTQGTLQGRWKEDLKDCLRKFIWCDTRLQDFFQGTCRAIQRELDDDDDSDSDDDDDEEAVDGMSG